LSAGDLLAEGWQAYQLGEYQQAAGHFEQILASEPAGSDLHLQALYGLATTWNLRLPAQDQDKEQAERLYKRILEIAPHHELAPWADLALARMLHLVPVGEEADYAVVQPAYRKIIETYPDTLAAREAFVYLMATKVASLETNELLEAISELERFVGDTRERSFHQPAYSLLAVSLHALGRQAERLNAEIRSLESTEVDPTNPYNEFSWQYWNLATIAEFELGDFETARAYYRKLLEEYPRDRRRFGAKQALKRMDDLEAKLRAELGRGGGS